MQKSLQELINTDKAFSSLSKSKGSAHAFSKYLTRNAVMLPHNQKPIKGVKNIAKAMKTDEKEVLTWEPQSGKVAKSQDIGYTWGSYTVTLINGKKIKGKYINIWRRQQDGSWKVEVDMGNLNPN